MSSSSRTSAVGSGRCESDSRPVDPWESAATNYEWRDNWLLSYIDILTLFLFLVIVLLVLQSQTQPTTVVTQTSSGQQRAPLPKAAQAAVPNPQVSSAVTTSTSLWSISKPAPDETVAAPAVGTTLLPADGSAAVLTPAEAPAEAMSPKAGVAVPSDTDPSPTNTRIVDGVTQGIEGLMDQLRADTLANRLTVTPVAEGVQLQLRGNILFAPASDTLLGAGKLLLSELVDILKRHEGMISVEGHTDDQPIANRRFPSNWELSSARATGVARYLIMHGFHPEKLRVVGYGDTRPLASNKTASGRAQNRRVTLVVHMPHQQRPAGPATDVTHQAEMRQGLHAPPPDSPWGSAGRVERASAG